MKQYKTSFKQNLQRWITNLIVILLSMPMLYLILKYSLDFIDLITYSRLKSIDGPWIGISFFIGLWAIAGFNEENKKRKIEKKDFINEKIKSYIRTPKDLNVLIERFYNIDPEATKIFTEPKYLPYGFRLSSEEQDALLSVLINKIPNCDWRNDSGCVNMILAMLLASEEGKNLVNEVKKAAELT